MSTQERTYRIGLNLPEQEALAISKLAQSELRDLKSQARFLIRVKLIELGLLAEDTTQNLETILKLQS